MNRTYQILSMLIVALLLVATGLDAALDRLANSPSQNSFTVLNERGAVSLAYTGEAAIEKSGIKPAPVVIHRT